MANHYEVPDWAGKPPVGLHLDVLKGERLVQKLMLDEKKCYLFGRNKEMCDFTVDHQSCSRIHAAFVYHKNLQKGFLVDLGSTHGTFIGRIQIEPNKPVQLPIDSQFHFGHSTRIYTLRSRPQSPSRLIMEEFEDDDEMADNDRSMENELSLDNMTEYNTAHNRRIPLIGISDKNEFSKNDLKSKKRFVTFNDEEEIINPEDIDPSIGRFRNLVRTTVIPTKRFKPNENLNDDSRDHKINLSKYTTDFRTNRFKDLYYDIPGVDGEHHSSHNVEDSGTKSVVEQLGLPKPNPAPEVETIEQSDLTTTVVSTKLPLLSKSSTAANPPKKKYAKEAWPGKKPVIAPVA